MDLPDVTAIFSFGDVDVSYIAADTTVADYVMVFAVGNVLMNGVGNGGLWISGGTLRKVLIAATGLTTLVGAPTTAAHWVAYSVVGAINGSPTTAVSASHQYAIVNNVTTTSYQYGLVTSSQPGVVEVTAGTYIDAHWFDITSDTSAIPTTVNNVALTLSTASTPHYYNLTATTGATVFQRCRAEPACANVRSVSRCALGIVEVRVQHHASQWRLLPAEHVLRPGLRQRGQLPNRNGAGSQLRPEHGIPE